MTKKDESEAAFLAAYDAAAFERLSVAVDVVLLGIHDGALGVVAVKRTEHPFKGELALPGGFVAPGESLDDAAARVLEAKAALSGIFLEQLYTFGEPLRDPRTRVIGVAYYALVDAERFAKSVATQRSTVVRIEAGTLHLAFDHAAIVRTAVERVRGKLDYAPIGYELLARTFTLLDLQRVHEIVGGRPLNKDSFRRKMLATGMLEPTGEIEDDVGHRPAALYRYVRPRRRRV